MFELGFSLPSVCRRFIPINSCPHRIRRRRPCGNCWWCSAPVASHDHRLVDAGRRFDVGHV
eukprot:8003249-Heterocapsa_arctica.AAC.1